MYYLGVDVGGTTIKAGLVDDAGSLRDMRKAPTIVSDLDEFVVNLFNLITDFQKSAAVSAVGIGIPGLLNANTRIIEVSPNVPCLRDINLEGILSDRLRLTVTSENDANAGAYAEAVCGAAMGRRHVAYLTLGTGLGCGLVIGGKLYRGATGYAGEFGHTTVEPNGRLCSCGNRGCLEMYVSGTAIVITAQELMKTTETSLTAELIYEAALRGDSVAAEVFAFTGRYLGIACANLMNLLNPEAIVVGGGVMASGDMLLKPAEKEAQQRAFASAFAACPIVQSYLWPDAGVIGAAMLARDRLSAL